MSYTKDDFVGEPRYEFIGETKSGKKSNKFWIGKCVYNPNPEEDDKPWLVAVIFGRVNTQGQTRDTGFDTEEEAITHLKLKTQEKVKKGYKLI